ncbi:aminotransferase class I/II-fold pyridoxal phosphate-dependent enzyme [Cellulophaga sp. Z1A5H]|uniref:aminotransferase class I/II-fold pyridoxal phosphate-dependent enzyme n=1 Tax=Cellulophaga sp. Z1A5H TaxID=2687291 RepID=UPI0013FD6DAE|nr:aminotransferase class I/II-fold pyridoxal phosphate-dependent enzyme [Cellulophaga sp. Z1A5H]
MIKYIDSFPGKDLQVGSTNYLYFGGTAYLGLQTDVEFQNLYIDNIRKYGTNYGASRKSNIRINIYDQVEGYLAKLVGSEACLSLSSGYLAGQFIGQFLNKKEFKFFYTPNTHSALYVTNHEENKPTSYVTFSSLNIAIRDHLEKNKTNTPVVFLDSIDFSGANFPDYKGLQALPLEDVILVVDDSHGIGITGKNGGGVFRIIENLNPKELIVCCSLGKGFGVQGGAIFASSNRIKELTNTIFFGGASPASPANLASIYQSEALLNTKRILLYQNVEYFRENIDKVSKFKFMLGHPAFTFSDEKLTAYLEEHHILVTSFRYPNENANLMSRIIISAAHTKEDISTLCKVINLYFK